MVSFDLSICSVETFWVLFKDFRLFKHFECLNLAKNIWTGLKYFDHVQKFLDGADGQGICHQNYFKIPVGQYRPLQNKPTFGGFSYKW